jgi:hypothetical protein
LLGFVMDFSDAQFIGLALAYGKMYFRVVHNDRRHDRDPTFLVAARTVGDQFVEKYCKGCEFHYAQSVRRVSMHVSKDEDKTEEFKALAFSWQKAPLESQGAVLSALFPVKKTLARKVTHFCAKILICFVF